MSRKKRALLVLLTAAIFAASVPAAFGNAPGPGDKQCRGATGNNNPHCPPG